MTRPNLLPSRFNDMLFATILLLVLSISVSAQTGTSSIRGVVRDPQDNVISGATVTLTNVSLGFTRTQTTTESGGYSFTSIPPGIYRVDVEVKGFKKATITDVRAPVDKPTDVPVQLEVGDVKETVNVQLTRFKMNDCICIM